MGETTRWTVNVAAQTDLDVRTYLAQRGMKTGGLSRFIEEAVKWRLLDLTLADARAKFNDLPPDELDAVIEEAMAGSRQNSAAKVVIDTNMDHLVGADQSPKSMLAD